MSVSVGAMSTWDAKSLASVMGDIASDFGRPDDSGIAIIDSEQLGMKNKKNKYFNKYINCGTKLLVFWLWVPCCGEIFILLFFIVF